MKQQKEPRAKEKSQKEKWQIESWKIETWEYFLRIFYSVWGPIEKEVEREHRCLPLHWYDILLVINRSPEKRLRFTEIAERIITSKSSLSRSIEKLEKAKLVKRKHCPLDKRGQYAEITALGVQQLKRSWVFYRKSILKNFAATLSHDEIQALYTILKKMRDPSGT